MELESKLDEVDRVVNKMRFDLLKDLLLNSNITSADTLKRVTMMIHDNAVAEPSLYTMYAQLCSDLIKKLPSFPYYGKDITFKRLLLNKCQETFEGSEKLLEDPDLARLTRLQTIGNICFIGHLFIQKILSERIVHEVIKKLISSESKLCLMEPDVCVETQNWTESEGTVPAQPKVLQSSDSKCLEVKVEAVCQLLNIVGKQLFDTTNPDYRLMSNLYFHLLEKCSAHQQLAPHLCSMIDDLIDLRSNNWVPKQEKVKGKSILAIHVEAGNMQLTLGMSASIITPAGLAQGT